MKSFGGKVFFIDRDNINTDEIIPAKYLTYIEKEPLKSHLLEDLKVEGIDPNQVTWEDYGAVVARANFGSGSSREMAPWAFEVNGINVIIATNFARIFRENSFNVGMLAIELSADKIEEIFQTYAKLDEEITVSVDLDTMNLSFLSLNSQIAKSYSFSLNPFQKDLVMAGGWVDLAQQKY